MCIWGIASWIPPIQLTYLASWIWKWYEVVNNPYIAIYITEVHPSNGLFSMWLISHFYQSGLLNILNMWLMHDWQHHFFLGYPHFKKRVQRATSGSWDRHDIMTSHVARLDWRFEKLATPRNSSPAPGASSGDQPGFFRCGKPIWKSNGLPIGKWSTSRIWNHGSQGESSQNGPTFFHIFLYVYRRVRKKLKATLLNDDGMDDMAKHGFSSRYLQGICGVFFIFWA